MRNRIAAVVVLISILTLLAGCGSKEPAFTGYIYSKDAQHDHTVVVGLSNGSNGFANVLIREEVSKLEVGSKVEVYYTDDAVNSTFPTNARARLIEVKTSEQEKEVLRALFEHIYDEYGQNVYPLLKGLEEQTDLWEADVSLASVMGNDSVKQITGFTISNDGAEIAAIYE